MGIALLTSREQQVLELLAHGHDAKSIAKALQISPNTVNERLRQARTKLGATSSREAARLFFSHDSNAGDHEKHAPEKMVLADSGFASAFIPSSDERATDGSLWGLGEAANLYEGESLRLVQTDFLPLRKPGERILRATIRERMHMIFDLSTKAGLTFVTICLAAMLLSALLKRL